MLRTARASLEGQGQQVVPELFGLSPAHVYERFGTPAIVGNSPGRVIFEGQREDVVRPRVRQRQANDSTIEVLLTSYESARNPERLQASILAALMAGVSTREIKNVQPDPQGTSKSNVSRHWQQGCGLFSSR